MSLQRSRLFFAVLIIALMVTGAIAQPEVGGSPLSREEGLARAVEARINSFRAERGLPPLSPNAALTDAAFTHTLEMVQYDFFDHNSPLPGRTRPNERTSAAGYASRAIAENLFMSMGTADEALVEQCVNTWANSPGHLRNMLDTTRTEFGVGVAFNSRKEAFITAVFGSP